MSEHDPISDDDLQKLMGKKVIPNSSRAWVDAHLRFSGEHVFASEEERQELRRAHFADIGRKVIKARELSVGDAPIGRASSYTFRFF